jgi:hypothetical protein
MLIFEVFVYIFYRYFRILDRAVRIRLTEKPKDGYKPGRETFGDDRLLFYRNK